MFGKNLWTKQSFGAGAWAPTMTHLSASKPVQRRVAFGVSKFWIPHVAVILFIYYALFSPQEYVGNHAFWTPGTFTRVLVGGKTLNVAVALMWIIHAFEAAYTVILARRYETTFVVGVRCLVRLATNGKTNRALKLLATVCARYTHIRETWVGRAFQ